MSSTTYVAIGDSTVEGLDDPDPQSTTGSYRGWADRLAEHLATSHDEVRYANLAVRGSTSAQVVEHQLEPALALRPDLAVVVCGVNDLLRPKFDPALLQRNLELMFGKLAAGGAQVVTYCQPDPIRLSPLVRPLRRRVFSLNEATRAAAASQGALILDLEPIEVAGDPRLWSVDRLHANTDGHIRIAAALAELLGVDSGLDWSAPLDVENPLSTRAKLAKEATWVRHYLGPYVLRGLRGRRRRSSGEGITAKRPVPTVVGTGDREVGRTRSD